MDNIYRTTRINDIAYLLMLERIIVGSHEMDRNGKLIIEVHFDDTPVSGRSTCDQLIHEFHFGGESVPDSVKMARRLFTAQERARDYIHDRGRRGRR